MCPNLAASMCVNWYILSILPCFELPLLRPLQLRPTYSAANPDLTHFQILDSGPWQFCPCFTTMLSYVICHSPAEFSMGIQHGNSFGADTMDICEGLVWQGDGEVRFAGTASIARMAYDIVRPDSYGNPGQFFGRDPKFQVFAKVSCAWVQIYTSERGIEPRSQGWEPCILTVRRFGIHTLDVSKTRQLDIKRTKKRKKEMWTQLWCYGTSGGVCRRHPLEERNTESDASVCSLVSSRVTSSRQARTGLFFKNKTMACSQDCSSVV